MPTLPPLPTAFRVRDADVVPGGRSVVEVLADDHQRLTHLSGRLREARRAGAPARRYAEVLSAEVSRHLSAEEQYLYPTARDVVDGGATLVADELAADVELLRSLVRLRATPDALEVIETVDAQVRRHAERSARTVLPPVHAACTTNDLIRLGNRVAIARAAAPTRPHPATPVTPPANKVVDPCVAVVDKVRDVLSRRITWPDDL